MASPIYGRFILVRMKTGLGSQLRGGGNGQIYSLFTYSKYSKYRIRRQAVPYINKICIFIHT